MKKMEQEKSERSLMEKEKEVNEKWLSFFTHISHEFKDPLTLIINPIKDLLLKSRKEEVAKSAELSSIYCNTYRLISLLDQLLLFRQPGSEAGKLRLTKLNFCNLCREFYQYSAPQAKSQKIQFELHCASETIELYGDRDKMEIILNNLLSNAQRYTPQGGKIIFSIHETDQTVEVKVSDTGIGISQNASDELCENFCQVKAKDNPCQLCFGIGLYLVKHLVKSHKGEVSYEREPGKGTTIFVKFRKGKDHFDNQVIFEDPVTESFLPFTLQQNILKVSVKYKNFLNQCIAAVERHLHEEGFNVHTIASEMGMSYSSLYNKVKSGSGHSVSEFIRIIRLINAGKLFISSDKKVSEIAFEVGIKDIKYFREHFSKLFGMNPKDYIKKYRKTFGKPFHLNEEFVNPMDG